MWEGVELWKKLESIAILYTELMQKTQEKILWETTQLSSTSPFKEILKLCRSISTDTWKNNIITFKIIQAESYLVYIIYLITGKEYKFLSLISHIICFWNDRIVILGQRRGDDLCLVMIQTLRHLFYHFCFNISITLPQQNFPCCCLGFPSFFRVTLRKGRIQQ